MRNYFPKTVVGCTASYFVKIIWCFCLFCNPPPLFWGWILLILRSPKGGCCSISDDLSCSWSSSSWLGFNLKTANPKWDGNDSAFPFSMLLYTVAMFCSDDTPRACSWYECFILKARRLSSKLLKQGFLMERLKSSFKKFYGRYGDLI